jgi:hypothetical protein
MARFNRPRRAPDSPSANPGEDRQKGHLEPQKITVSAASVNAFSRENDQFPFPTRDACYIQRRKERLRPPAWNRRSPGEITSPFRPLIGRFGLQAHAGRTVTRSFHSSSYVLVASEAADQKVEA